MAKDKIESIEDLKELAKDSFNVLKPHERRKGKLQLSLDVGSYIELQWLIIDIVKVSMAALDAGNEEVDVKRNFSNIIARQIPIDYNYISSIFSTTEGITIEQFIILQRIERVKELLVYNELSLSEIAYKLGYSNVQHLSTQFKKITGLTPSHFKLIKENKRTSLDQL
jgi:AraC family transcriptional regulator